MYKDKMQIEQTVKKIKDQQKIKPVDAIQSIKVLMNNFL